MKKRKSHSNNEIKTKRGIYNWIEEESKKMKKKRRNRIIKILVMNMNSYLMVLYRHENIYEVFTILNGSAVEK